jgi:hypothetical protein
LVGDDKVARSYFFLQRSNGGEGDDGAHTDVSQRGYVGLVLDLMRRKFVVKAMSRDERDRNGLAGRR